VCVCVHPRALSVVAGSGRNLSAYLEYTSLPGHLPPLVDDVAAPSMAAALRLLHTNIWMGDGRTVGKLHFDPYDNLLVRPPQAHTHLCASVCVCVCVCVCVRRACPGWVVRPLPSRAVSFGPIADGVYVCVCMYVYMCVCVPVSSCRAEDGATVCACRQSECV
jgi:hypothetical protein